MSSPQSPGGPSATPDARTAVAGITGSFARLFARGSPFLHSTRLLLLTAFVLAAMFAGLSKIAGMVADRRHGTQSA